jgi:hypothetical protein
MSAYDKTFIEIFALSAMDSAAPGYARGMSKAERPDWQNFSGGIGLEVVQAINKHIGYTYSIANTYLGKSASEIPARITTAFRGEMMFRYRKLFAPSDSRGPVNGTRHIRLALESLRKKHEKLNSAGYSVFERNELFVFLSFSANTRDVELFLSGAARVSESYEKTYSRIILFDKKSLFYVLPDSAAFEEHRFGDAVLYDLGKRVRKLREASEWGDGTQYRSVLDTIEHR